MNTRRQFLAATAGGLYAVAAHASTRSASRYAELEARIARRDLKNLFKEDLPTPCMVVDLGIFEKGMYLVYRYRVKLVAESEDVRQRSVIAFGIDNAKLVRLRHQALDDSGGDRGFAATRRSGDEDIRAVWSDCNQRPVRPLSNRN